MSRLRNRMVKAEFWTDPELLRWPLPKRVFYQGLWALAEDSGCLEDDAFGWKLQLFPSPADSDITLEALTAWRDELVDAGKVVPYEVGGKRCLYLRTFHRHESPRNPQRPDLPLPPWVEVTGSDGTSKDGKRWLRCRYEVHEDLLAEHLGVCTDSVQTPNGHCTESVGGPPSRPVPTRPDPSSNALCADSCEPAPPKGNGKVPKVSAPTEADWQARADAVLEATTFPGDYMRLAELLAEGNKSGKTALSRVVRELYEPLLEVERQVGEEAMRAGLRAAIAKPAPNATYVKRAAESYATRPQAVAATSRAMDRSAWDDFYTGGEL